jgi:hypothetical protein
MSPMRCGCPGRRERGSPAEPSCPSAPASAWLTPRGRGPDLSAARCQEGTQRRRSGPLLEPSSTQAGLSEQRRCPQRPQLVRHGPRGPWRLAITQRATRAPRTSPSSTRGPTVRSPLLDVQDVGWDGGLEVFGLTRSQRLTVLVLQPARPPDLDSAPFAWRRAARRTLRLTRAAPPPSQQARRADRGPWMASLAASQGALRRARARAPGLALA